tara:strand:- start:35 stop:388 length:354 start_codon:yes stop_codon:yes gene_type:complete
MALFGKRRSRLLYCSFCGRDQNTVAKLIAGPGLHICDGCVELCNGILQGQSQPDFQGRASMSDEALLATLGPSVQLVDDARETLQAHIDLLRERKVSWGRIGEALGVSRQAAWERFG